MNDNFLSWGENIWFTVAFSQFDLFCPRTSPGRFHAVHIPWWLGNGSQSGCPDCPLQKNFSSRPGSFGPLIAIAISNDALQVFEIIRSMGNCLFASLHSLLSFNIALGIVGRAEFVFDAGGYAPIFNFPICSCKLWSPIAGYPIWRAAVCFHKLL